MNKRTIIDLGKEFLKSKGITDMDYIVSLQGPTLIFTANIKLDKETKSRLKEFGFQILGG
jgi:hypothetical protein